ncbi:hypothetical protein M404DRAFT_1003335 [Pisolithus tinctorius Marx 270]|uniref:Uncharacterized protein n=1 Tax=Pisolithus tinctorius Marx 270 TaxID=870435 RepID=A0A0C3IW29_PISTI|nr:hypothetical protein M404DRAFT_1003335 [Pisolithus tinctorius Marx 270]
MHVRWYVQASESPSILHSPDLVTTPGPLNDWSPAAVSATLHVRTVRVSEPPCIASIAVQACATVCWGIHYQDTPTFLRMQVLSAKEITGDWGNLQWV